MGGSDKLRSNFGLKALKTDQVLPVFIFVWSVVVVKAGYRYATSKIIVNKANTSTQLIQQYALCPWVIYYSLYGSYLVFKWLKRCHHHHRCFVTVSVVGSIFTTFVRHLYDMHFCLYWEWRKVYIIFWFGLLVCIIFSQWQDPFKYEFIVSLLDYLY